ncbi:MAG: hypothetical protein AB8H86_20750 [Polyangiales bacterium]
MSDKEKARGDFCGGITLRAEDSDNGVSGVRLYKRDPQTDKLYAELAYLDAVGGYGLKTLSGYLPLEALAPLLSELRNTAEANGLPTPPSLA